MVVISFRESPRSLPGDMVQVRSFPPLEDPRARVLILGSMPGRASLAARQYYAHPQNAFWPIMGALVGAAPELPYPRRVEALTAAGIALWDVLASCERKGSLDAAIHAGSMVANDFPAFFARHRRIAVVMFNGGMAEVAFRRHVLPALDNMSFSCVRLPSTSPAHASASRSRKLDAWREALQAAGIATRAPDREPPLPL